MVDIGVQSGAAWVCPPEGPQLADVLRPVLSGDTDGSEEELSRSEGEETTCSSSPVLLEQTEDGSPCVLTLRCSAGSPTAISRLLLVSEARTMEVYSQAGEYCGTVRGERDGSVQPDSSDRGPFYRKQLILEHPSAACEVKLLSLAGRSSVLVRRVIVGLRSLQAGPARGPGIDMQQVQCLVDEMGTSLSPGAQNLMEMVHFQQKNHSSSLGSFLPLLMGGGALSALAQGAAGVSPAAVCSRLQPADIRPEHEAPAAQNGVTSSPTSSPPGSNGNPSGESRGPVSHSQISDMMSHFLKGRGGGQAFNSNPELLPMLQSICDQVTKLRLDDAAVVAAEEERKMMNGSWDLDSAMERRLEEMERRLKEHVDRRLDALEQKLEKALLVALSRGAAGGGGSAGEGTPGGPLEQPALAAAMH